MNSNSAPRFCLVMTTINSGDPLDGYCRQAENEGVRERLRIIVIPDRKTPQDTYERAARLRGQGFDVVCPSLEEQETYLAKFSTLAPLVPYNSDNRRNIGFLMALEWGADILLSIDDDNYCLAEENTYAAFSAVNEQQQTLPVVRSSDGWFNICDLLQVEPNYRIYPRGFPYRYRHANPTISQSQEAVLVRLNAGLWLQHPDLDGITWLGAPALARGFKGPSLVLGPDTWSPINTQNTSLHRDLIVAFYFLRMDYPIAGLAIDRYGDIFSGYFVQFCARRMGHSIRVGSPLALHRRNSHNYLNDLTKELAAIWTLEDLLPWLHDLKLTASSYGDLYLGLADELEYEVERLKGFIWTDTTRGYFHQMAYCMRQWVRACRQIG